MRKLARNTSCSHLGTHFCCLHFAIMPLISNKNSELLESNWSNYTITIKWTNAKVRITIIARNSVIMIKFPLGYSLLVDTVPNLAQIFFTAKHLTMKQYVNGSVGMSCFWVIWLHHCTLDVQNSLIGIKSVVNSASKETYRSFP